ncbi:GAF domain-containing protein [Deinococcus sp. QL22]|uniref:GAF domain-containing protein n=1 Tax=Deinococcus sp. QL22 TaxID=2939437 RepID=UPI0020172792|nr:GAF domain-containing protein [Deinococcus sp. QL22]UQN09658.1 GAF domain-containing protein [Deinococcus sp. QL22]
MRCFQHASVFPATLCVAALMFCHLAGTALTNPTAAAVCSWGPPCSPPLTAYYAVPLLARGKVLGVIEVLHRQALPLSPMWLEMLGGQPAIAIDNAQLFAELERKNLELHLAYDEIIEG